MKIIMENETGETEKRRKKREIKDALKTWDVLE